MYRLKVKKEKLLWQTNYQSIYTPNKITQQIWLDALMCIY